MRAKKVIAGLLAVSALFGTNFVTLSSGVSELVLTASALAPQAWGGNATYTVDNATSVRVSLPFPIMPFMAVLVW